MLAKEQLREAALNVWFGVTHCIAFCVLSVALLGFTATADAIEGQSIVAARSQFDKAGASTFILRADDSISGSACDALARLPGVVASGALSRESSAGQLSALPEQTLPVYAMSAGYAGFEALGSVGRFDSVAVSRELSDTVGAGIGEPLTTDRGEVDVDAIYRWPSDGRLSGLGYAVLERIPNSRLFDECWMQLRPGADSQKAYISTALSAGAILRDVPIELVQLNSTLGQTGPDERSYVDRLTAQSPWLMFPLGCLVAFAFTWPRRIEIAASRHSGAREGTTLALRAWELWIALMLSLLVSVALLTAIEFAWVLPALESLTRPLISYVAGCTVSTFVTSASIQERLLFRYFKVR